MKFAEIGGKIQDALKNVDLSVLRRPSATIESTINTPYSKTALTPIKFKADFEKVMDKMPKPDFASMGGGFGGGPDPGASGSYSASSSQQDQLQKVTDQLSPRTLKPKLADGELLLTGFEGDIPRYCSLIAMRGSLFPRITNERARGGASSRFVVQALSISITSSGGWICGSRAASKASCSSLYSTGVFDPHFLEGRAERPLGRITDPFRNLAAHHRYCAACPQRPQADARAGTTPVGRLPEKRTVRGTRSATILPHSPSLQASTPFRALNRSRAGPM